MKNESFYTPPSIGISLFPRNGSDKEALIKYADAAMYEAKKQGRNHCQFYIPMPEGGLDGRVKLEQGLRKALDNQELILHYQPQIDLHSGEWKGLDALPRWDHPEFGPVPPVDRRGNRLDYSHWKMGYRCGLQAKQRMAEARLTSIKVAVKVSALQFKDPYFVAKVSTILQQCQLALELLELEITESVMQEVKESALVLQELRDIGVKLLIDGFGTGYSSLNVLNRMPINTVKIDRSFVNDNATNSNTASLVKTMIGINSNLQFDLIAEGIEQEVQADFLNKNDCRLGQGFLYSPPLPTEKVGALLKG